MPRHQLSQKGFLEVFWEPFLFGLAGLTPANGQYSQCAVQFLPLVMTSVS